MPLTTFGNRAGGGPISARHFGAALVVAGLLLPQLGAAADPKPGSSGRSAATPSSKSASSSGSAGSSTKAGAATKSPATKRSSAPAKASGLGSGAKGPAVTEVQTLLQAASYDIRDTNGSFGDQTFHAVMAFQKANGLPRTGRVGQQTLDALRAGATPEPIVPNGGPDRIEVSLPKQYLALYRGGNLVRILSVSTGSGKPFCTLDPETNETACDTAITPPGSFRVARRVIGWRESKLGLMYNPLYFNGGIAVHGAPSVPGSPASHGCVRIPMVSADFMPTVVPDGIPVYVSDGITPLKTISARISPANAWPGTVPAPTPTTVPGTASTTVLAGTIAPATIAGATTVAGVTSTVAPSTVPASTTTGAPTTTAAPVSIPTTTTPVTLARPLPSTTVPSTPPPPAG